MASKKKKIGAGTWVGLGALALLLVVAAVLVVQQTALDEGACVEDLATMPATCDGGTITSDTILDNSCRAITCGDRTVEVCPKPFNPPYTYIEMYHKGGSFDPNICVGGMCITDWGFKKYDVNFCNYGIPPPEDPKDIPPGGIDTDGDGIIDACTGDAQRCDDGTFVYRELSKDCAFATCPVPQDDNETTPPPEPEPEEQVPWYVAMGWKTWLLIFVLLGVIGLAVTLGVHFSKKRRR